VVEERQINGHADCGGGIFDLSVCGFRMRLARMVKVRWWEMSNTIDSFHDGVRLQQICLETVRLEEPARHWDFKRRSTQSTRVSHWLTPQKGAIPMYDHIRIIHRLSGLYLYASFTTIRI